MIVVHVINSGASALTLCELIDFLVIIGLSAWRRRREQENDQIEKTEESATVDDVTLSEGPPLEFSETLESLR